MSTEFVLVQISHLKKLTLVQLRISLINERLDIQNNQQQNQSLC